MHKLNYWLSALLLGYGVVAAAAEIEGRLDWAQRVEMSTPVSGTVQKVLVEVGARVKKGEALLVLDPRPFKARVDKAQAELVSAKETLEEAKREQDRAQELFDRQVMSTHELQLEKIALTNAEAAYQRARSESDLAKLDLEYSTVRAPFPAIVLQRQAQPGQTVVTRLQTTPLLVLASSERMVVRLAVAPDQLARLQPGSEVQVRVAGRSYQGSIGNLGLEPEQNEQGLRYDVEINIPAGADQNLRAGMVATVVLPE